MLILATCLQVKGPVAKVRRDFRGSARDSLAGRPSNCEKHLENFSQFCLWVFWWPDLATCWRLTPVAKNACLAKIGSVFKTFSVFPSNFCDYSLSSPFLSQLNLTQTLRVTHLNLHFCIIPSPIFKKKVWVFSVSLDFFMFWELIFFGLSLWFEIYYVRTCFCLNC